MDKTYLYHAFITYRRSDGRRVARRLRRRLLDYQLPDTLRPSSAPARLAIYLDTLYERATQDFFDNTIKPALAASRHLIIVQSPDTLRLRADGQENWVVREIRYFQTLPQGKNMAVALAQGTVEDPLPANLGPQFPNIERVDMRPLGRLIPRPVDDQLLTFIATLYDIPPEHMPDLRREETLQQLRRVRRRAVVFGVAFLVVVGLLLVALVSRQQARSAQALAETRLQTANSLRLAAESRTQGAHRTDLALLLAAQALDIRPTVEARSALLAGFDRSPQLAAYLHCASFARAVAFASSGNTLAIACDKEVTFWDIQQWAMNGPSWKTEGEPINLLRFDPSSHLLAASGSNALRIYDLQSQSTVEHTAHSAPIRTLAFSHDGKLLSSADGNGVVLLWSTETLLKSGPTVSPLLPNPVPNTAALAFSPDDHLLALAGDDGDIRLYAVPNGEEMGMLCCHSDGVSDVKFLNTKTILSSSVDGSIRQWNLEQGTNTALATDAARRYATKLALSDDTQRFAYVTEQNVIKVGSVVTGAFEEFKGHTHNVFDLTFGSFSQRPFLASAGEITPTSPDGPAEYGVLLWEVPRPHPLARRLARYSETPVVLRFVPGRPEFVCAGCGGGVELWQLEGNGLRSPFPRKSLIEAKASMERQAERANPGDRTRSDRALGQAGACSVPVD